MINDSCFHAYEFLGHGLAIEQRNAQRLRHLLRTLLIGMSRILILFQLIFGKKTLIRFRMSLVQFVLKTLFGSDIVVIYYLCNI